MGLTKFSWQGTLMFLGMAAVGCAAAWLMVRPIQIRWFRWPWWSFALLAAGLAVRAGFLLRTHSWESVLAIMAFYLLTVAFQEEFIFRGCVEEGLSQFGPWAAAAVAGLFFGLAHAPLDILQGASPSIAVPSSLGGGVVYQFAMRWLRERGGLAIPVLVHGLLDSLGAK